MDVKYDFETVRSMPHLGDGENLTSRKNACVCVIERWHVVVLDKSSFSLIIKYLN